MNELANDLIDAFEQTKKEIERIDNQVLDVNVSNQLRVLVLDIERLIKFASHGVERNGTSNH